MSAPDPRVVEQAIAWRVRLASGEVVADACQRWRAQHPEHELAWQRLEALDGRFAAIPAALGHATLAAARHDPRRRRALKALGLLAAAGGAGLLGVSGIQPLQPWLANLRTGVGERRTLTLPEGARLHINAGSALDLSAEHRLLRLYQGEILLDTGVQPSEPVWRLDTGFGSLRSAGARLLLRQREADMLLAVYAGAVELQPAGGRAHRLEQGWQATFDARGVGAAQPAESERSSWVDGVLVARDMRLDQFVAELERQRHGVLRCDPAVAGLRISGVFPLDDSERALAAVERTLPVRVLYRTRWWVTLQAA